MKLRSPTCRGVRPVACRLGYCENLSPKCEPCRTKIDQYSSTRKHALLFICVRTYTHTHIYIYTYTHIYLRAIIVIEFKIISKLRKKKFESILTCQFSHFRVPLPHLLPVSSNCMASSSRRCATQASPTETNRDM